MAKKIFLTLIAIIILASFSRAATNPWSNLKKIYFFDSSGDLTAVKENLTQLDAHNLLPAEKIELLQKLNELGDRYFQKKNFPLAEAIDKHLLFGRAALRPHCRLGNSIQPSWWSINRSSGWVKDGLCAGTGDPKGVRGARCGGIRPDLSPL